jgi:hypothetical protein
VRHGLRLARARANKSFVAWGHRKIGHKQVLE